MVCGAAFPEITRQLILRMFSFYSILLTSNDSLMEGKIPSLKNNFL
jgi:hypothetical protein